MLGLVLSSFMLSAAPSGEPVHTFVHNGAAYEIYLAEEAGEYSVSVCGRYVVTGSRLERNTCNMSPTLMMSTMRFRTTRNEVWGQNFDAVVRTRAKKVARRANELINTNTEVEAFWQALAEVLQKD